MSTEIPHNIPELWCLLDRRLTIIEEAQKAHCEAHAHLDKTLDDHEQRLRSAGLPATSRTRLIRLPLIMSLPPINGPSSPA